jgi:hypothetical protein
MKKAELEALSHAHSICRILDGGPKMPYLSTYDLPEERVVKVPEVVKGVQLEQHELF